MFSLETSGVSPNTLSRGCLSIALPSSPPFFLRADLLRTEHRADATQIPLSSRAAYTSPPPVPWPFPQSPLPRARFVRRVVVRHLLFAACAHRRGGRSLRGAGCLRSSDAPPCAARGAGREEDGEAAAAGRREYRCRCMHIDGGNDDIHSEHVGERGVPRTGRGAGR